MVHNINVKLKFVHLKPVVNYDFNYTFLPVSRRMDKETPIKLKMAATGRTQILRNGTKARTKRTLTSQKRSAPALVKRIL